MDYKYSKTLIFGCLSKNAVIIIRIMELEMQNENTDSKEYIEPIMLNENILQSHFYDVAAWYIERIIPFS